MIIIFWLYFLIHERSILSFYHSHHSIHFSHNTIAGKNDLFQFVISIHFNKTFNSIFEIIILIIQRKRSQLNLSTQRKKYLRNLMLFQMLEEKLQLEFCIKSRDLMEKAVFAVQEKLNQFKLKQLLLDLLPQIQLLVEDILKDELQKYMVRSQVVKQHQLFMLLQKFKKKEVKSILQNILK